MKMIINVNNSRIIPKKVIKLNALRLTSYLRKNACEDGKKLQMFLQKQKTRINESLMAALPNLPKVAATSRPSSQSHLRATDLCDH
jgi:hypothetical protein